MSSVTIYDRPDWSEALHASWTSLFAESPTATPFQSWEWHSAWSNHFLGNRNVRIYQVFEGHDLIGIYPAFVSSGVTRFLRPMGIGVSDYLHPLARAGQELEVAKAIGHHTLQDRSIDLIDFHQIRETNPIATLSEVRLDQARCLVATLPATYAEYRATLGKNARAKLSKLERQVLGEGKATVTFADESNVLVHFEALLGVHKARWRKRLLPGAFASQNRQQFHRDFLLQAIRSNLVTLSNLHVAGRPVGAVYCMRTPTTLFYYQAGFDPEFGHFSPGTLLLSESVRLAIDTGATTFDLMRGDEPYKHNWKPTACLTNQRVMLVKQGVRASMGSRTGHLVSKIESKIRQRFEGKGLFKK